MARLQEGRMLNGALLLAALLCLLAMALSATVGAAPPGPPRHPQVLLVASDPAQPSALKLAAFIEGQYGAAVTVIGPRAYLPAIDERAHDGFVYLGNDYYAFPAQGFLADMARTAKPVLWINYHAWLLDPGFQSRRGLSFSDTHSTAFTRLGHFGLSPLEPTDTSLAGASGPGRVLYWLYREDLSAAIPGAVTSGNFTHVAYLPDFNALQPGFPAFRLAAGKVLSHLAAIAPSDPGAAERLRLARNEKFRAGIHLPFIFEDAPDILDTYDSDAIHANLLRIKDSGAGWVTLTRTVYQDGIRASAMAAHPVGTATAEALRHVARDAHKIGLHVRLSIIVNLTPGTAKRGDWRGLILPADRAAWWKAYRAIVLDAAALAREAGIESLGIGAELSAMESSAREWRGLVAAARKDAGYEGLVGYQVNYDTLQDFAWGEDLDYLSVAAYWPLAGHRDPSLKTLAASWDAIGRRLERWRKRHPRVRLEFGEVGYASQPYAAEFPFSWKPSRSRHLDLAEQVNCYLALEQFLAAHEDIEGVGIFASTRDDLVPGNIGYSPFGKPAERVLERLMRLR